MLSSQCVVFNVLEKSRFIKQKDGSGLLSSLGIKTPVSQIPIFTHISFRGLKMNKIISMFLLAEDKIISEMH